MRFFFLFLLIYSCHFLLFSVHFYSTFCLVFVWLFIWWMFSILSFAYNTPFTYAFPFITIVVIYTLRRSTTYQYFNIFLTKRNKKERGKFFEIIYKINKIHIHTCTYFNNTFAVFILFAFLIIFLKSLFKEILLVLRTTLMHISFHILHTDKV